MDWRKLELPVDAMEVLKASPKVLVGESVQQLLDLACGGPDCSSAEVSYEVPGKGQVLEATVARVKNGIAANYVEAYMRRRDPDCMFIADAGPSDKARFEESFGKSFDPIRKETFDWLKGQELMCFAFMAGKESMGADAFVIAPANAGFFALGLAMLQGIIPLDKIHDDFKPKAIIYVAPPFRHTHFNGRQVVVHNRVNGLHEMFSYNLYPGPSAKKGVYGVLIGIGEREKWVTAHCSTVQVVTPYDNVVTIMHEGASGGGKSEMLEYAHREPDGTLLLGRNVVSGDARHLEISRNCRLKPVTDDMAICHPALQRNEGKLVLTDAEDAWFLRVNHIEHYGVDLNLEKITAEPKGPLLFLNIDAVPGGRALIWEHIEDSPGKRCPNPRVVMPRNEMPDIVDEAVAVDIRSFGIRTPPCTKDKPSYGILGLFHLLPPSLAWLWRLVAPRGHANPSITDTEGMTSEGVGSYWPFATGRMVDQANLLLEQFVQHTKTRNIICPNQHVGSWEVSFMPQWVAREYLARRGSAKFTPEQLIAARCPLLGYLPRTLQVEGRIIPEGFLRVETQSMVGDEAYDKGAEILYNFFLKCLEPFNTRDLNPLGRQIIQCCLDKGTADDYAKFIIQE